MVNSNSNSNNDNNNNINIKRNTTNNLKYTLMYAFINITEHIESNKTNRKQAVATAWSRTA